MNESVSRRDFLWATAVTGVTAAFSPHGTALGSSALATPEPAAEHGIGIATGRCHECHVQCPMLVHLRNGRVEKVEGDPNGPNRGALCARGQATVRNLYSPERLNYPMKRTRPKGDPDPGWVRISWEEALTTIAATLNQIKGKYGAHAIAIGQGTGRYTEEHNIRLKNTLGTPNWLGPSHICRGPMSAVVGLTTGHHVHAEYSRTACQVYWGKNAVWSHAAMVGGGMMDNWLERNSKLIVVDPRFEHPLAHKADIFLPVRPGSDGALFLSWIHVVLSEGLYDNEFVTRWTNAPLLVRLDTMRLLCKSDVVAGGDSRDFLSFPECIADRSNGLP